MRIGDIMGDLTEANMRFAEQIGVTDLIVPVRGAPELGYYEFEELLHLRTRVESAGLKLAALHSLPSEWYDQIRYAMPGRDRQIENFRRSIRNMGAAGIPILGYQFHAVKVWRTSGHTRERGGAFVTSYDHALMARTPLAGPRALGEEELWDNFRYFLERVVPIAEEAGVKMALHPDDPPISPVAGSACPFRSVEAFQRVIDLVPSPSNGILFCQGCFTEMGADVYDAIRRFGRQGKIFYVHFRNVAGKVPDFRESFIDNGDVDMHKAMLAYRDAGYDGLLVADHMPVLEGDSDYQHRSRAYAIGYIRAMIQATARSAQG